MTLVRSCICADCCHKRVPEMGLFRRHALHGCVVGVLVGIIENFQRNWLEFLSDLKDVSFDVRQAEWATLVIITFCLIASSIGVIVEVMVEYGLLVAEEKARRNIRLYHLTRGVSIRLFIRAINISMLTGTCD